MKKLKIRRKVARSPMLKAFVTKAFIFILCMAQCMGFFMSDLNNGSNGSNKDDDILRNILGDDLLNEILSGEPNIPDNIDTKNGSSIDNASVSTEDQPEVEDDVDSDMKTYVTRSSSLPVSYYDDEDEPITSFEDDDDDYYIPAPRAKMNPVLKLVIYVISVLATSVLLAVVVWIAADDVLALTGGDEMVEVVIQENDDIKDVARKLKEAGLINYKFLFRIYGSFSNAEEKIETGTFELNNEYDYRALVLGMKHYEQAAEIVTVAIPEGYEQKQIFELLEENGVAKASELSYTAANQDFDYDFLDGLEPGLWNRLEGYLFPDTYDFYVDEDPVSVINKFLANFERKFDDALDAQIDVLNQWISDKMTEMYESYFEADVLQADIEDHMLTKHDVIIIASLIEKEAANNSERSKISSVIHNRLMSKLYPSLQIDATIQYVLEERKAVLTYDDQNIDSPYNTYKNAGLPVGPIANPGLASIRAVLYPDETDYYFYLLDKDGTHRFFETSGEHYAFQKSLEED